MNLEVVGSIALAAVMGPVVLCMRASFVVGAIWLIWLADWWLLGAGVLYAVATYFACRLYLLPSGLLGMASLHTRERYPMLLALPLQVLSTAAAHVVIGAAFVLSFRLFIAQGAHIPHFPAIIWAYAVSVVPWSTLADQDGGGATILSNILAGLGLLFIAAFQYAGDSSVKTQIVCMAVPLVISWLLTVMMGFHDHWSESQDLKNPIRAALRRASRVD